MSKFGGYFSLQDNINKIKKSDSPVDGVISDYYPELSLKIEDADLLLLTRQWKNNYDKYLNGESNLKKRQELNRKYWLGEGGSDLDDILGSNFRKPCVDNLIFEALETFLAQATKNNPQPVVGSDNTPEGEFIASAIQKILVYHADRLKFKLKLKNITRHWSLSLLGMMKVGWSNKQNDLMLKVINPNNLILDPDANCQECDYNGNYIGEYKKEKVKFLIEKFPKFKKEFTEEVNGKLDTELQYIEWSTPEYIFWQYKDFILDKIKTPYWNYEKDVVKDVVDEYGQIIQQTETITPKNHYEYPRIMYIPLTVFNLGLHPYDETNLIEQNIGLQDRVTKWYKQIEKNVENINGGWIVSKGRAGLTDQEAALVAQKMQKGGVVAIPDGAPREAIDKFVGSSLPPDVYNSLQDARNQLRSIFGTTGLTPQGTMNEQTVRGKIIVKGQDGDRIGSGIAEYLEQFADSVFNAMVQMIYVYYDSAKIMQLTGSQIPIDLNKVDKKLSVSVKEGSLIPKDSMSQRNEAVDLFTAGALDPLTLFEKLELPDPKGTLQRLIMWKSNPMSLIGGNTQTAQPQSQPTQQKGSMLNQVPIQ